MTALLSHKYSNGQTFVTCVLYGIHCTLPHGNIQTATIGYIGFTRACTAFFCVREHIARNASAPIDLVDSMIASGALRMTRNARGQPAFEPAEMATA